MDNEVNYFLSDVAAQPVCNYKVLFDSPPDNFKVHATILFKDNIFYRKECFFKINKVIMKAIANKNGLEFYNVSGVDKYKIGSTQWNTEINGYDLFIGYKKILSIEIQRNHPMVMRVCFEECKSHDILCNKWPFVYKLNELTENVYTDKNNFSLCRLDSPDRISMSMAKRTREEFILVYFKPWCGFTAFAIGASMLICK